jgi:hypothetical protein
VADNYTTGLGSGGPTFASDDVGGVQYPRVKLSHGADGSASDASDAAPLPVRDPPLDQLIDEADSTTTYICEAVPGTATSAAAWRVQRVSVSGTVTTIRYAGTGAFNQVADNRASLTYP